MATGGVLNFVSITGVSAAVAGNVLKSSSLGDDHLERPPDLRENQVCLLVQVAKWSPQSAAANNNNATMPLGAAKIILGRI